MTVNTGILWVTSSFSSPIASYQEHLNFVSFLYLYLNNLSRPHVEKGKKGNYERLKKQAMWKEYIKHEDKGKESKYNGNFKDWLI